MVILPSLYDFVANKLMLHKMWWSYSVGLLQPDDFWARSHLGTQLMCDCVWSGKRTITDTRPTVTVTTQPAYVPQLFPCAFPSWAFSHLQTVLSLFVFCYILMKQAANETQSSSNSSTQFNSRHANHSKAADKIDFTAIEPDSNEAIQAALKDLNNFYVPPVTQSCPFSAFCVTDRHEEEWIDAEGKGWRKKHRWLRFVKRSL